MSDNASWRSLSELVQLLDPDMMQRLLPHLHHAGFDGPCIEVERFADLLKLLDQEGDQP